MAYVRARADFASEGWGIRYVISHEGQDLRARYTLTNCTIIPLYNYCLQYQHAPK